LSSEYGPPALEIAQGWSLSQVPGVLILVAVLAFAALLRQRQPTISFGIAFACIALLPSSNFVLPAGILLAERTLFLPSVGAVLVAGALCVVARDWIHARFGERRDLRLAARALFLVVLAAGVTRSAQRTTVWRNNERLFHQAVIDSPGAYRAHYMLGAWAFENKRRREGETEYHKALSLFPYDPFLSYNMAEQYRLASLCGPAVPLYRWTYDLNPKFPLGHSAFAWCLLNEGFYPEARARALDAIRVGGDVKLMRRVIFIADSAGAADRKRASNGDEAHAGTLGKLPETVQKAAVTTNVHPRS
jgi:hypothetical protein